MEIDVSLMDLASMHPRLLWDEITLAAVAVLSANGKQPPYRFELAVQNLPSFGSNEIRFAISPGDIIGEKIARLRRTYEPGRLIEFSAIAIAGLGLYYGGGHEIHEIAVRGSGADYTVNESCLPLEVAGRSRRSDLEAAWEKRWQRLSDSRGSGFFVCVAEFETPAGRLSFAA